MMLDYKNPSLTKQYRNAIPYVVGAFLLVWIFPSLLVQRWGEVGEVISPVKQPPIRNKSKIPVLTAIPHESKSEASAVKYLRKLESVISQPTSPWHLEVITPSTQKKFILKNGKQCHDNLNPVYEHFLSNGMTSMALELWKYCKMVLELEDHPTIAYIDYESPLLTTFVDIFDVKDNYAVVGDDRYLSTNMIHGAVLIIQKDQKEILKQMISAVVDKDVNTLKTDPFFISRTLYNLIYDTRVIQKWKLLVQRCHIDLRKKIDMDADGNDESTFFKCPLSHQYCCEIQAPVSKEQPHYPRAVMMTTHFVLPQPLRPNYDQSPKPYALHRDAIQVVPSKVLQGETPFIVTLRDDTSAKRGGGGGGKMKNNHMSAYHQLTEKKCLTR